MGNGESSVQIGRERLNYRVDSSFSVCPSKGEHERSEEDIRLTRFRIAWIEKIGGETKRESDKKHYSLAYSAEERRNGSPFENRDANLIRGHYFSSNHLLLPLSPSLFLS